MCPYLFEFSLGGQLIRIPAYGVFLATAFSVAYVESLRRALRLKESPKHIENLFLIILASSVVGSRLFHVLFEEFSYYSTHIDKIVSVWEGGYTLYGGVLCAMAGLGLYAYFKKLPLLQFFDIAAPSTTLGIAIGRIGCFMAGCCWGQPTKLPWGVTFTHPSSFTELKGIPLHPTQLYESLAAFALTAYLYWLFKRRAYKGQILFHSMIGYAIIRYLVEFLRADAVRGFIVEPWLSYSQAISIGMLVFGTAGILYQRRARSM